MEHINVETIIEFVSMDGLSAENIELSRTVNAHLRICSECRDRVCAVHMLYDALLAECRSRECARRRLYAEMDKTMERRG